MFRVGRPLGDISFSALWYVVARFFVGSVSGGWGVRGVGVGS